MIEFALGVICFVLATLTACLLTMLALSIYDKWKEKKK